MDQPYMGREEDGHWYLNLAAVEPTLPREVVVFLRQLDVNGDGKVHVEEIVAAARRLWIFQWMNFLALPGGAFFFASILLAVYLAGGIAQSTKVVGSAWVVTGGAGSIVKTSTAEESVPLALLPLLPERLHDLSSLQ